jgi:hypothetical protein
MPPYAIGGVVWGRGVSGTAFPQGGSHDDRRVQGV